MNELLQRYLENRTLPYAAMSIDDWKLLELYARNYSFNYKNGNDSLTILGNTALFREVIKTFDIRGKEWASNSSQLNSRKYSLKMGTPETIAQVLRGFNVSFYEW